MLMNATFYLQQEKCAIMSFRSCAVSLNTSLSCPGVALSTPFETARVCVRLCDPIMLRCSFLLSVYLPDYKAGSAVCHFLQIRLSHCLTPLQILNSPASDLFEESNNGITGRRMYSLFLRLPARLSNTNTITTIQQRKLECDTVLVEFIFF